MTPLTGAGRLLERERELATISAAVDTTASGSGAGLVIVEGPAGIGKSQLLGETRRRAEHRGLRVLTARGSEYEREFPFGVVRQLFEEHLAQSVDRESLLAGAAAAASSIFIDAPPDDASGDVSFGALNGLYWLALNIATEQPLVLVIDDLHWCDRPSLRYLAYLARRLDDTPALVVASLRPAEPGADAALLAELVAGPQVTLVTPGLLSAAAAAEVVRDRLGDAVEPAFAEACHRSTQGNPLLLSELLKAIVADEIAPTRDNAGVVAEIGPRAASRAVLLRLARLPAEVVRVARAIAVLGDGTDLGVVAALESMSQEDVAAATRELVRVEILRPDPPLGFVHPLVEGAVYRDLSPGERDLYQERAAETLAELGAPVERVAAHLLATPPRGRRSVVDTLRSAAQRALAKGAPDAAVASLERALTEPPPVEERALLNLELGRALALTSLPDAANRLEVAYESLIEPELRAAAAEGFVRMQLFGGTPEHGATVAQRAAAEVVSTSPEAARRLEALEYTSMFFGASPDVDERLDRLRAHHALTAPQSVGERMLATIAAWEWTEAAGPCDEVVGLARAALGNRELHAADPGLYAVVATIVLALVDLDEAVERWTALRADAIRMGSIFAISGAHLWGGHTQLLRGELIEAESELRQSLDSLSDYGIPTTSQWSISFLADVLIERGNLAEARTLVDGATYPPDPSDQAMLLDRAQMLLLLAEGRTADALAHADVFAARAAWKCHPRYVSWRSLKAIALDRAGRTDEAVALAVEELEIARRWGSPGTVGYALRVLGTIEREDGIDRLEEACGLLETASARLERAKALAALGGALRRARRPTEAREPLQRALELAEVAGATVLVEDVRSEIYATGMRPRTTAFRGVGALTASERRVADLAAAGQSNRDIAQSLFVTPKTVEVHLTSAYRKLGIRSRRDLGGALASA